VYPVTDAIGGTTPEAHRAGLERVIQAGGQPITWVSLACELQLDWARQDTADAIAETVLAEPYGRSSSAPGNVARNAWRNAR